MRRIRYRVAASLDGYIAGPNGEIDWIAHDPSADFAALFAEFDAALLGRRTYELTLHPGAPPWPSGWQIYVFSQTLPPIRQPAVTLVSSGITEVVSSLRDRPGRDIWLFGGGRLFASLLNLGLVDTVEVAVMPVLLGGGVPLLASDGARARLALRHSDVSPSGIVNLRYDVER